VFINGEAVCDCDEGGVDGNCTHFEFTCDQGRELRSRPGDAGAEHRGPGALARGPGVQRRLAPQGKASPAMRGPAGGEFFSG